MSLAQISPTILVANPSNVNPLAHSSHNVSAAAAGALAQQKTDRSKSDSVTISRQALEKAARAEKRTDGARETPAPDNSQKEEIEEQAG